MDEEELNIIKFEDATLGDFMKLNENGVDLMSVLFTKINNEKFPTYKADFKNNSKGVEGNLEASFILPKNVYRVKCTHKYKTKNGIYKNVSLVYNKKENGFYLDRGSVPKKFSNQFKHTPLAYLMLSTGDIISILEYKDLGENFGQEEAKELLTQIRSRETQEAILKSIKNFSLTFYPLSKDKDDIEIFYRISKIIFGNVLGNKLDIAINNIKLGKSYGITISPEELKKIRKAEEEYEKGNIILFDRIYSSGPERDQNGVPYCSRTVVNDAKEIFGINLPSGDAKDVQKSYVYLTRPYEIHNNFSNIKSNANFADVFFSSRSIIGHRCIGLKKGNSWYIIDTYSTIGKNTPIPLDKYLKLTGRKVKKIVAYSLKKKIV